jgi:hypothetical protein
MGHCTLERETKKKKQKTLSQAMEEALAVHTQEEEEEEERNETLNPQTLKTQSLRKREAFLAQKEFFAGSFMRTACSLKMFKHPEPAIYFYLFLMFFTFFKSGHHGCDYEGGFIVS